MEEKIGVFICTGYGIADALDIEALSKVATGEYKVPFCKTVDSLEADVIKAINDDIRDRRLNQGRSRRVVPTAFYGCILSKRDNRRKVPILEHVVWCQPANDEDTQMMAEDYLRMYIVKLQKMDFLEPFE